MACIMPSKVLCQSHGQDSTNFTGLGRVKHLEGILICGGMLLAERFLYKNANVSFVTEVVPLHDAMTPKITKRVRICALKLQDQNVIWHTAFDGSFPRGCQEYAVPKSLVALVSKNLA